MDLLQSVFANIRRKADEISRSQPARQIQTGLNRFAGDTNPNQAGRQNMITNAFNSPIGQGVRDLPNSFKILAQRTPQAINTMVMNPREAGNLARTAPQYQRVKVPGLQEMANFSANAAQTFGQGLQNMAMGVDKVQQGKGFDKVQGAGKILLGAGQTIAPFTGAFQAADLLTSLQQSTNDILNPIQRFSAGAIRGIGQDQALAPNIKNKNSIKLKFGDEEIGIDPFETVGQAVGFVKNPVNSQLFKSTEKIFKAGGILDGNFRRWAAVTGGRGLTEGLLLGIGQLPDNISDKEKLAFMAQAGGLGIAGELVGRGSFDIAGKGISKLKDSKIAVNAFNDLKKLTRPVKTMELDANGERIVKPMWKYFLETQGQKGFIKPDEFTKIGKRNVANAGLDINGKPLVSLPQPPVEEVTRVANNLIKNNPGLGKTEAGAMARDVIRNSPFNKPNVGQQTIPDIVQPKLKVVNGKIKVNMEGVPSLPEENIGKIIPGQLGSKPSNAAISSISSDGGINPLNSQTPKLRLRPQTPEGVPLQQGGKIPGQKSQNLSQSFDDDILAQEGSKIKNFEKQDKRTVRQWASDFYTDWVNRFEPIEKLGKQAEKAGLPIKPEDNPQYAIKSLLGAGGKAELRHKQKLDPIIKDLGDVPIKDFDLYLKAKRDIGFGSIGRDIKGSDPETGKKVINALSQKYDIKRMDQVAGKLYQYQDEGLKTLQDAGFITKEGFDVIKARNPNYVPFQRVMDDLDNYLGVPTKKAQQSKQPIDMIKGSDKDILSPVESVIANTYKMEAAIAKNNVARTIADFPEINPAYKDVITKVSKSSSNAISVWQNGKKEFYEVPEDINRAVKGLNEESMGTMMGILSAPAKILRQGATGRNIDFMLPNVIRDQLDAAINSKYGYKPIFGWFDGLAQIASHKMGKGDLYKEYINSGGKIFFENMAGRKGIAEQVKDSVKSKNIAKKILEWGISGIETLGKYSEEPTRVGLFAQARRRGAHPLEAAFEARESTVDFARMGAKMKVANSLIPFLNVQIQGFDKMVRSATRNPAAFGMKMAAYGLLPQTMASVYNNFYHGEDYARVPDFEKESNVIIMQGQDDEGNPLYLKIPKGHATQLVMNPADHFVTWLAGNNPQSFGQLALAMLSSTLPVLGEGNTVKEVSTRTFGGNLPQFLKPGVEAVSNFNFFKGNSIVPYYMGKKPAEEQFFKTTPTIYKKLGEITGISPLHLKNFAEATLAGGATQPANLIENALNISENKPIDMNKIPVLRRFRGSYGDFDVDRPDQNTKEKPKISFFSKANASDGKEIKAIKWTDNNGNTQTVELNKQSKPKDGSFASYKEDTDNLSDAVKIYHADNSQVTRETKLAAFKKLGYEEGDIRYHARAKFLNSAEQAKWYSDKFEDHDTLVKELVKGRVKSVGGEYMANQETLQNLRDAGRITSAEYKYINSLKLDKDYKPLAGTGAKGGSGKKGRKVKIPKFIPLGSTKVKKDGVGKIKLAPRRSVPKVAMENVKFATQFTKGGGVPKSPKYQVKFNI